MRTKTIKIPIYEAEMTIVFAEDLSYVQQKYNTTNLENFGAVTLTNEAGHKHYVVAFTDTEDLSLIAHEVVHVKNQIFLDCGIQLDRVNDEPEAYLTGWLFHEIYKFLNTI